MWSPPTFLSCFWRCLARFIRWVHKGYCPNFFIPENNMMMGKFDETTKPKLLLHLLTLYNEGYKCLLRCPSLRNVLSLIIQMPIMVTMLTSAVDHVTKISYDIEAIREMIRNPALYKNEAMSMIKSLDCIDRLMGTCKIDLQCLALHVWKYKALCRLYLLSVSQITDKQRPINKSAYQSLKKLLHAMCRTRVDPVYHYILLATGMYKQGQFKDVGKIGKKIRAKLQIPHIIFTLGLNDENYRASGGENTPLITMMKEVVVDLVFLNADTGLSLLNLEHRAAAEISTSDISFPPLVLANFLLFLSNWNMGYWFHAEETINDMSALVHFDDGYHINAVDRAISWEILGICQEMMGDYQGAYQSYTTALQQPNNEIKAATKIRLRNLLYNSPPYVYRN